jgi:hypothetical protein
MTIEELEIITEMYKHAVDVYRENGKTDYDAGRVEGIKEILEAFAAP